MCIGAAIPEGIADLVRAKLGEFTFIVARCVLGFGLGAISECGIVDRGLAAWFWLWCGVQVVIGFADNFFDPLGYTVAVVAVVYF